MEADAVDLGRRDRANDDPLRAAEHGAVELLALARLHCFESFRQRERPHAVVAQHRVVEQHAGHDERPGERPAPRLVGACDEARAELAVELRGASGRCDEPRARA